MKSRLLFLLPLALGAASIGTLLLYFYGAAGMGESVKVLLLPALFLLALLVVWARRTGREELYERTLAGLWAGGLATLAYDVVRVPIAMSGVPVFKAISYFGTVILGQQTPTLASEVVGWTYHLTNGIGFGLMYAAVIRKPRWWTAVLWGLFLEFAMLRTPYAEVFGYKLSQSFVAISLGAHVVYGLALWFFLRQWSGWSDEPNGGGPRAWRRRPSIAALTFALVPLGIGTVAADFHVRHVASIPPSPPPYLGPHLYSTWNALEPDRLAAMWILKRFVDPEARFHFVEPFSHIAHGTPFDTPEAEVRRTGGLSATEVFVADLGRSEDANLALLGRMAQLYEITPWRMPSDPVAHGLGLDLMTAAGRCETGEISVCVERAFTFLDRWYQAESPALR